MDNTTKREELQATIAFLYKITHDIMNMKRDAGYSVNDFKALSKIQSVLEKTGEDLEDLTESLEKELEKI